MSSLYIYDNRPARYLVFQCRSQIDFSAFARHPGFNFFHSPWNNAHNLGPSFGNDDVIFNPDAPEPAELFDALLDQELGELGILEGSIQEVIDEVATRLD